MFTLIKKKGKNERVISSGADIHQASAEEDLDRVAALVAAGVSVDVKDNSGFTPLYLSVQGKHIDTVRFLLGKGADPNSENGNEKRPPLIEASEHGFTDVAACLLDHKALVNQGDIHNFTPLWWAACEDQTDTAEFLLSRGADIHITDLTGGTPLHIASGCGNYNTAALLLQHGADGNMCNNNEESSLHRAVSSCFKNIVQLLLQHRVKITKNDDGETPLDVAHRKMQELDPDKKRNITECKSIIPMLENYNALQKLQDGSDTERKLPKKTQGSAAQSDKLMYKGSSNRFLCF